MGRLGEEMSALIYQTEAEAKETKKAHLAAEINRMCAELRLSKCEAALFKPHFGEFIRGRISYDQSVLNIRTARNSIAEANTNIQHVPGCRCSPAIKAKLRVLGLDVGATLEEIKSAYRRLAKQSHPDTGGDPSQFRKINEAYRLLTSEEK
jgi:hypothetical protein